jgi:predicted PurR-regulated permease PerM
MRGEGDQFHISGLVAIQMNLSRRSDIVFAAALVIALLIAYYLRHALLLIYVSILFAIVLTPAVQFIQKISIGRWRPGKGLAILLLLITLIVLVGVFIGIVIPPIVRDVHEFAADLPARVPDIMERLRRTPALNRLAPQDLQEQLTSLATRLPRLVTGIAGGLLGFFSWLILTTYFVVDGRRAAEWGLRLLPDRTASELRPLLLHARDRVRRWMLGQLLLMLTLGVLSAVVYNLLGIRYATGLAVFTGLANIVPIVGPVVSVLLAAVAAALDSWLKALGVLAFYAIYQQLENGFLTPRIMKATVELPALAVVVALLIGGELAGLLGGLVAVPSAALIAVFVDEYLLRRPAAPELVS